MNIVSLISFCLKKPVLTAVTVFFILMTGFWALFSIPIQLTPDIEAPKATVRTFWPGASPYEIEREILARQEEHLNNLPGLVAMNAQARTGRADITLEFEIGTDMNTVLPRIGNELGQVTQYPENASQPTIILSDANSSPTLWANLRPLDGNTKPIQYYKQYAEDVIKPEIEKIRGIAEMRVYGGRDAEVHVIFDPERMAVFGITIPALINRLRQENVNVSAGAFSQGKRQYTIRTVSRYHSPEDLGGLVVKAGPEGVVYLRDLAETRIGYGNQGSVVRGEEGRALILPMYREVGSNVLEVTQNVYQVIERLNEEVLKRDGLRMKVISDPSYYIDSAIDLVLQNIYLGGILAILALYLFLGNLRSSLVIALSIPISLIGTFIFLKLFGRNINVISLAGLAFAVGMVMDAAIVVLENIDTWRKKGHSRFDSLLKATHEVYGAILASALTTVAVFLPVVFVEDQAGQLFRDIALAIVFAILLSFLVSTTVIPPLYRLLFDTFHREEDDNPRPPNAFVRRTRALGHLLTLSAERSVGYLLEKVWRKLAVVLGLTVAAIAVAWFLTPKLEYLPGGNRNLLFSLLFTPPGYNEEEVERMGEYVVEQLQPFLDGNDPTQPRISRLFFVNFGTTTIMGAVSEDPARIKELIPHLNKVIRSIPGVRGITSQSSLFERGLAAGRSIDVEIYGQDIEETANVARSLFLKTRNQVMPGAQIRPLPSFDLGNPEVRIMPNPERAAAAGLSTQELGLILDIYTDGRKISEFTMPNGKSLDLVLMPMTGHIKSIGDFESRMILAGGNRRVAVTSVADVMETVGPNEINHIEGERAFTLRVSPPDDIALETALEILERDLVAPARQEFAHIPGIKFNLSGTAQAFTKTRESLESGFLLALAITFLLLVILFEDLLSPLVIMAALPVAAAGGLMALWFLDTFVTRQPLDMLTMLGFLMMIGIVVNNPILMVSRALSLIREESWPLARAVVESVRSRLRPIFMTTCTSVFGLMPLVLMPGAGSELYRGLGAAVLGGLVLSTLVNVVFVPCLFSLFQDLQLRLRPRRNQPPPADEAAFTNVLPRASGED